jgi:hypothetical protein
VYRFLHSYSQLLLFAKYTESITRHADDLELSRALLYGVRRVLAISQLNSHSAAAAALPQATSSLPMEIVDSASSAFSNSSSSSYSSFYEVRNGQVANLDALDPDLALAAISSVSSADGSVAGNELESNQIVLREQHVFAKVLQALASVIK